LLPKRKKKEEETQLKE